LLKDNIGDTCCDEEQVGLRALNVSLRCLSASHANKVLDLNAVAFFKVHRLHPLVICSVLIRKMLS